MPPPPGSMLGISLSVKTALLPLNGLRHPPDGSSSGWYIWAGEDFPDDKGFHPLHISHIADWNPLITKYLALPPGWRFLTDGVYEDVWFDAALINV